jgi:hypothetical protein
MYMHVKYSLIHCTGKTVRQFPTSKCKDWCHNWTASEWGRWQYNTSTAASDRAARGSRYSHQVTVNMNMELLMCTARRTCHTLCLHAHWHKKKCIKWQIVLLPLLNLNFTFCDSLYRWMLVLWNVIPYSKVDRYQHFHQEARKCSCWFLRNVFAYLRNYNVSHPERP